MQSIKLEISFDDKRELDAAWAGILRDISYLSFLPLSLAECISFRVFSLEGSGSCRSSVCMSREVAILCRAVMPPSPLRDRLEEALTEEVIGGHKVEGGVRFLYGLHKAMWLYLATHPGECKEDALTHLNVNRQLIEELGAKYEYCPACMYAAQMNADVGEDNSCVYCPFDDLPRCSKSNCLGGLYENWRWGVEGYNNFRDGEVAQHCAHLLGAQAGVIAYTIAHLPLKEDVEYVEDFPEEHKECRSIESLS